MPKDSALSPPPGGVFLAAVELDRENESRVAACHYIVEVHSSLTVPEGGANVVRSMSDQLKMGSPLIAWPATTSHAAACAREPGGAGAP